MKENGSYTLDWLFPLERHRWAKVKPTSSEVILIFTRQSFLLISSWELLNLLKQMIRTGGSLHIWRLFLAFGRWLHWGHSHRLQPTSSSLEYSMKQSFRVALGLFGSGSSRTKYGSNVCDLYLQTLHVIVDNSCPINVSLKIEDVLLISSSHFLHPSSSRSTLTCFIFTTTFLTAGLAEGLLVWRLDFDWANGSSSFSQWSFILLRIISCSSSAEKSSGRISPS